MANGGDATGAGAVSGSSGLPAALAAFADERDLNARANERNRASALEEEGKTVAVLFEGVSALGLIAMRDEPRADAVEAVPGVTRR